MTMPKGLQAIPFMGLLSSSALVVSNDAPEAVKVGARLAKLVFGGRIQICTGANDNVEIQAAIDALPSGLTGGGEVHLLEGNYYTSATINLNKHCLTLSGCGSNTVIRLAAGCNVDVINVGGPDALNGKIMNLLRDFRVEQTGVHASGNGINLQYAGNPKIVRVHSYEGIKESCIKFSGQSHDILVTGCTLEFADTAGIFVYGDVAGSTYGYISNNFLAANAYGVIFDGAYTGCILYGNDIHGTDEHGVEIRDSQAAYPLKIIGNKIAVGDMAKDAIYFNDCTGAGVYIADDSLRGRYGVYSSKNDMPLMAHIGRNYYDTVNLPPIATASAEIHHAGYPKITDTFITPLQESLNYIFNWVAADNNNHHTPADAEPDCSRILSVSLRNNTGGIDSGNACDVYVWGEDLAVGGVYMLASNPLAIISFTAADLLNVANGGVVTKYSVVPAARAVKMRIWPGGAQPAGWNIAVGIGDKLGFSNLPLEVVSVSKNNAHIATPTVDYTYNTIDFSVIGPADTFVVHYLSYEGMQY